MKTYDCVVVGGGPAGATAATALARAGHRVMLLDRTGRIKPCGGAVPPRLLADFAIPSALVVGRATSARMIGPDDEAVEMPVDRGGRGDHVAMVDRETFDPWLRARASATGADCRAGTFLRIERDGRGGPIIVFAADDGEHRVPARCVIGADGARSRVAAAELAGAERVPCVFAYHEIVRSPSSGFDRTRCDVFYQGALSPDFFASIFPHGDTASVGVGSANKGFGLRGAVRRLRRQAGLEDCATIRCEGAPIPLRPLRRWDNGRDVLVTGDAAGVVAPASGEGIYYAMTAGEGAAAAVGAFLASGDARALRGARRAFLRAHGRVFWILRVMQHFWYASDRRRSRFVAMCGDRDVQELLWPAYLTKRLVYAKPLAYLRIFVKDMRHLMQTALP